MGEEETYLRAKLTEINGSIERLTEMLNRMIDVISKIGEVEEQTADLALAVAANGEKIDQVMKMLRNLSKPTLSASPTDAGFERAAMTGIGSVLDTLETQIREGVIASDLASKISDAAETAEQRGAPSSLVVKMNRWVRILRTYGRVDAISPTDLGKLREDLRDWQKEISKI